MWGGGVVVFVDKNGIVCVRELDVTRVCSGNAEMWMGVLSVCM